MSFHQISIGWLFHSRSPAATKLLSPNCDCVCGTVHVWMSDDLKCRPPTSVSYDLPDSRLNLHRSSASTMLLLNR